jgi:hypothetical protein
VSALIQRRQAHEMEDCLSAVSEAVAEVTGPPSSKMPAGAEAPGSEGMIDSPGRTVRRKKNKGRCRYGPGRLEHRKRQALIRQSLHLMSLPPLYQSTRSRCPPATTHPLPVVTSEKD